MESRKVSIINGQELGGSITKIKEAVEPAMLTKLVKGFHLFLDNLSGDVFTYDQHKKAWVPLGNTGLHDRRGVAAI